MLRVVYLLIPTSNHNIKPSVNYLNLLYIFWFLHQTTTCINEYWSCVSCISFDSYIKPQLLTNTLYSSSCCISFDSYIKPQHENNVSNWTLCCISFDSYIKPQLCEGIWRTLSVVYLLIPTSNHNSYDTQVTPEELYIFWFLHQTTTNVALKD